MTDSTNTTLSADELFLRETVAIFRSHKDLAEKTIAQLSDEELFYQPNAESNSIAIIMKHLAGNMISRWTDFLTTDGEKANRNRDSEFEIQDSNAAALKEYWQQGWTVFFATLLSLRVEDLTKAITIRNEPHSVSKALIRQISHYAYHVGQIVYVGKMIRDNQWKTLSIARGESAKYVHVPPSTASASSINTQQ